MGQVNEAEADLDRVLALDESNGDALVLKQFIRVRGGDVRALLLSEGCLDSFMC
jgi:hypothetical protein